MPTDAEIAKDPVVLSAEQAASTAADVTTLPPPGDARREELRRRADALHAAGEALAGAAEIGTVDPSKLKIENEIACYSGNGFDGSEVTNANPAYAYIWENFRSDMWVTQAKALGWRVVEGDMPEARERRSVDGTRRWGDTILLYVSKERYAALDAADRRRRIARKEGVGLAVLEAAERAGIPMHDLESNNPRAQQLAVAQRAAAEAARATMVSTMRQARPGQRVLASELANRKFDRALREGTVPGMPPGA